MHRIHIAHFWLEFDLCHGGLYRSTHAVSVSIESAAPSSSNLKRVKNLRYPNDYEP